MRQALAPNFRSLLTLYTDRLVEPLLRGLAAGKSLADHDGASRTLLAQRMTPGAVQALRDLAFWREHGEAVLDEFRAWTKWLDNAPLALPLPASSHASDSRVKRVFSDVLYLVGLNSSAVWSALGVEHMSRQVLCETFLTDVGHSVCAYCDLESVRGAYSLEHFIPRNRAIYLAVAARNLYVACSSCNSTQVGKGIMTKFPVCLPDASALGDRIAITVENAGLRLEPGIVEADSNYIALLKLVQRYRSAIVFRDASARAVRVSETASRMGYGSRAVVLAYYQSIYANEALYYASRAFL